MVCVAGAVRKPKVAPVAKVLAKRFLLRQTSATPVFFDVSAPSAGVAKSEQKQQRRRGLGSVDYERFKGQISVT